jgi:hypothetical protein
MSVVETADQEQERAQMSWLISAIDGQMPAQSAGLCELCPFFPPPLCLEEGFERLKRECELLLRHKERTAQENVSGKQVWNPLSPLKEIIAKT